MTDDIFEKVSLCGCVLITLKALHEVCPFRCV